MMKPSLSELNAFLTIAEHQSFRAAAKVLGISSSALSHSLRSLEAKLSIRLFNRTTRSLALTQAGNKLLMHIRPAISSLEHAIDEATSASSDPSGTVKISTSESGAIPLLRYVLPKFVEEFPNIRVEFIVDSRFVDIVSEGFDAGIRLHEDVPKDMIALKFQPPMRVGVVASPGYLRHHGEPKCPQDLSNHRGIRFKFENGVMLDWELKRDGTNAVANIDGTVSFTRGNAQLAVEAALNGLGLVWLPLSHVRQHLKDGSLIHILKSWEVRYTELSLYYPANRHLPPAVSLFLEHVRKYAVVGRIDPDD